MDNKASLKGAWLGHLTRFYRATLCYKIYISFAVVQGTLLW